MRCKEQTTEAYRRGYLQGYQEGYADGNETLSLRGGMR